MGLNIAKYLYEPESKGETKIKYESEVKNKMAEFKSREQKVQEYIAKNPGISYREATLKAGITNEEDYISPDETVRIAGLLDSGISSLDQTKDLRIFSEATQRKLNEAFNIINKAKVELEALAKV